VDPAADVASLKDQLQATFDCCGRAVRIEVLAGALSELCLMLWISAEDAWITESLLTATKEALMRMPAEKDGVHVLGSHTQPFTPQPHGFSALLALMPDKSQACWEMYRKGFCSRGSACRWQHPTRSFPINVVVATTVTVVPQEGRPSSCAAEQLSSDSTRARTCVRPTT